MRFVPFDSDRFVWVNMIPEYPYHAPGAGLGPPETKETIDESGEAKEYLHTLEERFCEAGEDPKLAEATKKFLDLVKENVIPKEEWMANAEVIALIFPPGKGREKFIQALAAGTEEAKKLFEEVRTFLTEKIEHASDSTGKARDYMKTFRKSRVLLDLFFRNLEDGMESKREEPFEEQGPNSFFNPELWGNFAQDNPEALAKFLDRHLPHGSGRNAFLNGLKAAAESSENTDSRLVLRDIIALATQDHFKRLKGAKIEAKEQKESRPFGDTLTEGTKTLMESFKKSSGLEKAMILGAAALIIKFLWDKKESTKFLPPGWKWGQVGWWVAGLYGINFLSGKVSKDGKTFINRLDIHMTEQRLDEQGLLRGAMAVMDIKESENYQRDFVILSASNVGIETLFHKYKEAGRPSGGEETIDPKILGPQGKGASGKGLYAVMDKLVKQIGVNYSALEHERTDPRNITDKEKEEWGTRANGIRAFEAKYESGPLSERHWNFVQVLNNEHRMWDLTKAVERQKAEALPQKSLTRLKKGVDETAKEVKKKAKRAYEKAREDFIDPVAGFIGLNVKKGMNKFKEAIKWKEHKLEGFQEDMRGDPDSGKEGFLPIELDPNVWNEDTVLILGVPVKFEKYRRAGKAFYKIFGVEFDVEAGVSGNEGATKELREKIGKHVNELFDKVKSGKLADKKVEWNGTAWVIQNLDVEGFPELHIDKAKKDVIVEISEDGKSVKLMMNGQEVLKEKGDKALDFAYGASEVERWIRAYEPLKGLLHGLPIKIEKIELEKTDPRLVKISGNIAGLRFTLPYKDDKGLEGVKIEGLDGDQFLEAKIDQLIRDGSFSKPYLDLYALMITTSEGIGQRLSHAWERRFWIFPDVAAGLSGRILQNDWRYTLNFKQSETLEIFREQASGKSLKEAAEVYKLVVEDTKKTLEDIEAKLRALSDEEKANQSPEFLGEIELMHYANPEYQRLYQKLKDEIGSKRFDYAGLDKTDITDGYYDAYARILNVWSHWTRQYGMTLEPNTDESKWIETEVIPKILRRLDKAKEKGGVNSISPSELPPDPRDRKWDIYKFERKK